jgi:RecA/RadA recombinase
MIIELFGPPGSGKTTFCHRLATQLREGGLGVELALSRRPAEPATSSTGRKRGGRHPTAWATFRRIARPASELLAIAYGWRSGVASSTPAAALLRSMPPRSPLRLLRVWQYLLRLTAAWQRASQSAHVTIFDQGFIQTVYSLAGATGISDPLALERALDAIPTADILIRIDAPLPVLEARLSKRLARQRRIERLLERDVRVLPGDRIILDRMCDLMRERGAMILTVESGVNQSSTAAAESVLQAFASRLHQDASLVDVPPRDLVAEPAQTPKSLRRAIWRTIGHAMRGAAVIAAIVLTVYAGGLIHRTKAAAAASQIPARGLHYAADGNFDFRGRFGPGRAGFNLADVSSKAQLDRLPEDVTGLVWVGQCNGADAAFIAQVQAFVGDTNLFGFYLMDDPDPTGHWHTRCTADKLREEADWIRTNLPGAKSFVALMNMGSSGAPSFAGTYNPENSHVDLFGIAPYPCRSGSTDCDLNMIDRFVAAALQWRIPKNQIVPIYQTFGGGDWQNDEAGRYVMPSPRQAAEMLQRWSDLVPAPAFDFAYSWGAQRHDRSLATDPGLRKVFGRHNLAERTLANLPGVGDARPPRQDGGAALPE